MLSVQQLFLRSAVNRANRRVAAGDVDAARDEMVSFVRRFPKSPEGWRVLYSAVGLAGGSMEDLLEVLRGAVTAVPYDAGLVDMLVDRLIDAAVLIGDEAYLEQASAAVDSFEEVLGSSAETGVLRATVRQFQGDRAAVLDLCRETQARLEHNPQDDVMSKLGLCLASLPGSEAEGIEIAESAARRGGSHESFLLLAAHAEPQDPAKAELYRREAARVAARRAVPSERVEEEWQRIREEVARRRRFLASAHRRQTP